VARTKQATPTPSSATPAKAGAHRPADTDPSKIGKVSPLLENLNAAEKWVPAFAGMARRYAGVKR